MVWQDYIPEDLQQLYEIRDYHHAAAILAHEFPGEFKELCEALKVFRITTQDIIDPGGNESRIPKKISELLRSKGWKEERLKAEQVIDGHSVRCDTHWIDYVKGHVAFDLEWNSKDPTVT
jgi:CRISPR-associated protein Csd2